MVAATLCGITDAAELPRSICAMGRKWMWNPLWGGLPPEDLLVSIDPLLKGIRAKTSGRYATSDKIAGHLSEHWTSQLRLTAGIPIPTGAFDAHWDTVGANIRLGDVVNVIVNPLLGGVIFAFLAAGEFATLEQAQDALCPPFVTYQPQPHAVVRAEQLYQLVRSAYFALGTANADATKLGAMLPTLRTLRQQAGSA